MTTASLMIDDAPSASLPAKLDLLSAEDVPAVLFCEGRHLDDHPENARRALEAGYHLGNHAHSHTHASDLTVDAFREEVRRTEERIETVYDVAGESRPARLFRFPYGDRGAEAGEDHVEALQSVLDDLDFASIDRTPLGSGEAVEWAAGGRDWGWTVEVEDWNCATPADLRDRLDGVADRLGEGSEGGGELVLFHDAGTCLDLFETLLAFCRDNDVDFGDPLALVDR